VPFLVLDALGSPDQSEARKDCLELLANSAAKGLPISLSEIDHDGLHEIHSVATPNSALASALLQLDGESHFLNQRDELQSIVNTSEDKALVAAEAERLRRFRRGSVESANMMNTLLAQLGALQQMALALQRVRGRKTVIWLTGYFPADVNEADDRLKNFPVHSVSIDYQKTIDLLNESQISLFPVEMKWRAETSNWAVTGYAKPFPETTLGDSTTIGLRRIARSTGGELMAPSDTLRNVVQHAEDQSTGYYLLKFQPELIKGDLLWKSLKVELQDKSLKAKSPDGLFLFNSK
jgi:VWFA-related protein